MVSAGALGVEVATDKGVTRAPDNATFVGAIAPADTKVEALARGASAAWGGGKYLWKLSDPATDFKPFGSDDDHIIRGMDVYDYGDELWIAADNNGIAAVAQVDATTGAVAATHAVTDGRARDIVVEPSGRFAGDVWVATRAGAARFKRDRGVWVEMDTTSGLGMRTDLKSIDLDPATRTVYAASNKGIVYIRVP